MTESVLRLRTLVQAFPMKTCRWCSTVSTVLIVREPLLPEGCPKDYLSYIGVESIRRAEVSEDDVKISITINITQSNTLAVANKGREFG